MPDPPPIFFDLAIRIMAEALFVYRRRQRSVRQYIVGSRKSEFEGLDYVFNFLAAGRRTRAWFLPIPFQPFHRFKHSLIEFIGGYRRCDTGIDPALFVHIKSNDHGADISFIQRSLGILRARRSIEVSGTPANPVLGVGGIGFHVGVVVVSYGVIDNLLSAAAGPARRVL